MCNEIDHGLETKQAPAEQPTTLNTVRKYGGIRRTGYWLGMLGVSILHVLLSMPLEPGAPSPSLLPIVLSLVLVAYRLRNLGMSAWWVLAAFVPIGNVLLGALCGICPEGYRDTRKLDAVGTVLAGILIVFLFLTAICMVVSQL